MAAVRVVCAVAGAGVCLSGLGGLALSMVLSDLGNGVTRVSEVALVPVPGEFGPEWEVSGHPIPGRVLDAVGVALGVLGRRACRCVLRGRVRSLSERQAQHLVWGVG